MACKPGEKCHSAHPVAISHATSTSLTLRPGWRDTCREAVCSEELGIRACGMRAYRRLAIFLEEFALGSMNPKHLKLLSDGRTLYRHLVTLAFAQHGPAQRRCAADDLNELCATEQLHAAPIGAKKEVLLLVIGIDQADQRAELYALAGVVGARAELAPSGHGLADGLGATSLAGGQIGGFEPQGVVFVFGDVFFVRRRLMGFPRGLFGLLQVFSKPFQHLLLQQEFIHDER
jgi:hypothetical protein